jgi:long-chain acyl-CoA synthetase
MPTLRKWAEQHPEKTASLVAFTDKTMSYRTLDQRSNSVAQLLMWMGLSSGDGIAIMLENDLEYFELVWGARRHGVYYTPVSTHLKADEASFIVRDSGAKIFVTTERFAEVVKSLLAHNPSHCSVFVVRGEIAGCLDYETELKRFDRYLEVPDGPVGKDFFYSSGTTGKPKGIKQPLFTNIAQAQSSGDWVRANFRFAFYAARNRMRWHRRSHAEIRSGISAACDRNIRGDPQPVGTDDVLPAVGAAQ